MKYNYPIYYAVMEIKDDGGFFRGYERPNKYYFVSKCYLLGKNITYLPTGKTSETYQVAFPYKRNNDNHKYFERVFPSTESTKEVDKIFTTFEEAYLEAENKNQEEQIYRIIFDSKEKRKMRLLGKLAQYKMLAKILDELTDDLIIGKAPTDQEIILGKKDTVYPVAYPKDSTIYDCISIMASSSTSFKAYTVNEDQYNNLKASAYTTGIKPQIDHLSEELLIYSPKNTTRAYLKDNHYYIENNKLYYNTKPGNQADFMEELSVYTMENYLDIMMSYPVVAVQGAKNSVKIFQKQLQSQRVKLPDISF